MPLMQTFYQNLPKASEALLRYMLELVAEEQALGAGERVWWAVWPDGPPLRLTGEEEVQYE